LLFPVPQNVLGNIFNDFFALPHIHTSFLEVYAREYNNDKPIAEVSLEVNLIEHGSFNGGKPKYAIKTRQDGSVIIHQAKMYTRDDLHKAAKFGRDNHVIDIGLMPNLTEEWIDETL